MTRTDTGKATLALTLIPLALAFVALRCPILSLACSAVATALIYRIKDRDTADFDAQLIADRIADCRRILNECRALSKKI